MSIIFFSESMEMKSYMLDFIRTFHLQPRFFSKYASGIKALS